MIIIMCPSLGIPPPMIHPLPASVPGWMMMIPASLIPSLSASLLWTWMAISGGRRWRVRGSGGVSLLRSSTVALPREWSVVGAVSSTAPGRRGEMEIFLLQTFLGFADFGLEGFEFPGLNGHHLLFLLNGLGQMIEIAIQHERAVQRVREGLGHGRLGSTL